MASAQGEESFLIAPRARTSVLKESPMRTFWGVPWYIWVPFLVSVTVASMLWAASTQLGHP
jgi:hypothetical protein